MCWEAPKPTTSCKSMPSARFLDAKDERLGGEGQCLRKGTSRLRGDPRALPRTRRKHRRNSILTFWEARTPLFFQKASQYGKRRLNKARKTGLSCPTLPRASRDFGQVTATSLASGSSHGDQLIGKTLPGSGCLGSGDVSVPPSVLNHSFGLGLIQK